MSAHDLLERYVRETASHLPVRMRSDVTLELASMLRKDLEVRAAATGRAPDEALALEALQAFGDPREVAARYHAPSTIIDPVDTGAFVRTVLIGGAILVAIRLPAILLTPTTSGGIASLLVEWTGVATILFAVKAWSRRRWRRPRRWTPDRRDPDRVPRVGMAGIMVAIGIGIAVYTDPQRIFAWLSGGGRLPGSLDYDSGFRSSRLPWLFAVWIGHVAVLAVLAVRGRRSEPLRRAELILSAATVGVLAWYCAAGPVMADAASDRVVKAFMVAIAFILLVEIAVRVHRQAGHLSASRLRDALSR